MMGALSPRVESGPTGVQSLAIRTNPPIHPRSPRHLPTSSNKLSSPPQENRSPVSRNAKRISSEGPKSPLPPKDTDSRNLSPPETQRDGVVYKLKPSKSPPKSPGVYFTSPTSYAQPNLPVVTPHVRPASRESRAESQATDPDEELNPDSPEALGMSELQASLEGIRGLPEAMQKEAVQEALLRVSGMGLAAHIKFLLETYPDLVDIDCKDEDGVTPLMDASTFGHSRAVKLLMKAGASVEVQDKIGWTALHWAANHGKSRIVKLLLRSGANVSTKTSTGKTLKDFVDHGSLPQVDSVSSAINRSGYSARPRLQSARHSPSGGSGPDPSDDDCSDSDDSVAGRGSEGGVTTMSFMSAATDSVYAPSTYGVDLHELYDIVGTSIIPASMLNGNAPPKSTTVPDGSPPMGSGVGSNAGEDKDARPPLDEEALVAFNYEECQLDQMFVFGQNDVNHILDVVVSRLSNPSTLRANVNLNPASPNGQPRVSILQAAMNLATTKNSKYLRKPVSANVLFLAARYAAFIGQSELLENFLHEALNRISRVTKNAAKDMMVLAYWISNCSRLQYFLKKDATLVVLTLAHQVRLAEILQEAYHLLVQDTQRRIGEIMDEAILNHNTIPGFANIKFREKKDSRASSLARSQSARKRRNRISAYFMSMTSAKDGGGDSPSTSPPRSPSYGSTANGLDLAGSAFHLAARSSSASAAGSALRRSGTTAGFSLRRQPKPKTPRTITTILSSMLYVMQLFALHPSLIHQAVEQVFFFTSSKLFNGILSRPELCCRWRAMQVRMNISLLEDWVRTHPIPCPSKDSFTRHLESIVGLLQFLQIATHLQAPEVFLETFRNTAQLSKNLNWGHVARAIDQYAYEIDEARVPNTVRQLVAEKCKAAESLYLARDPSELRAETEDSMMGPTDDFDAPLNFDHDNGAPENMPGRSNMEEYERSSSVRGADGKLDIHQWLQGGVAEQDPIATPRRSDSAFPAPPGSPQPPTDEPDQQISLTDHANTNTAASLRAVDDEGVASVADDPVVDEDPLQMMNKARGPVVAMRGTPDAEFELDLESPTNESEEPKPSRQYTYHLYDEQYWLPFAIPPNVGERLVEVTPGDQRFANAGPTQVGGTVAGADELYVEEAPAVPNDVMKMLYKRWSLNEE